MEGIKVSVDRIVIDFTNINWDYFNSLRKRLCEYYNANLYVKEQGFKYRVRLKEDKYWAYLSYQLIYAKPARKHTLRLECHPDTIIHFKSWIAQLGKQASEIKFVRCDVANYKSKQGNRELHDIFKALAIRQIAVTRTKREPRNPYFHAYYEQKMAAGKTKQQAIVCIMRKLVNVIYYLMKTKAEYVIPIVSSNEAA